MADKCASCHTDNEDGTWSGQAIDINNLVRTSIDTETALADFIETSMPPAPNDPADCASDCAANIAAYMWSYRSGDVVINLIEDNGFESSESLLWVPWNGETTLSRTTEESASGSQSLRVSDRTAANAGAAYILTDLIEANSNYSVSAQLAIGGDAADNARVSAKVECSDPPEGHNTYPWVAFANEALTPGIWTSVTGTLSIPQCSVIEVLIYVEGPAVGTDLYADDIVVTPAE